MLQQSQIGLFHSLLFDILSKIPALIPILFPSHWGELYLQKIELPDFNPDYSKSLSNLTAAFETLLTQTIVPMKLCLFVDGLDEYSGLSSDIARLLKRAAHGPNVKVCVSSRPYLVFKESFETQPQLRLEDLTKGDIKKYVVDMLEKDERTQERAKESVEMRELVDEIELLRGLENHDRIPTLRERLRVLPTDLEELYEHVVFKVDSVYRKEASRFYQLVAASVERDDDWKPVRPLTILTLYLAEDEEAALTIEQTNDLPKDQIQRGIQDLDSRLRSRCGGLIETQFGTSSFREIVPEMKVSYIHRTVKDYLDSTGIRNILSSRTGGLSVGSFNPHTSLIRTNIRHLKILECAPSNSDLAEELINAIITFSRRAEADLCEPNTEFIEEFFEVAKDWWRCSNGTDNEARHHCILTGESPVSLAVKCGLSYFLTVELMSGRTQVDRQMLNCALAPAMFHDKFVSENIVSILREYGRDPNEKPYHKLSTRTPTPIELQSPWQNALTYLVVEFHFLPEKEKDVLLMRWEGIIKLLLQNGANPNVNCVGPKRRARAQNLEGAMMAADNQDSARKSMEQQKDKPTSTVKDEELHTVTETTMSAKQVIEKTFEKKFQVRKGLLKLLDMKVLQSKPAVVTDTNEETPPSISQSSCTPYEYTSSISKTTTATDVSSGVKQINSESTTASSQKENEKVDLKGRFRKMFHPRRQKS